MSRISAAFICAAIATFVSHPAGAAGFAIYEHDFGTDGIADFSGAGALASDASTVFANPAGMTNVPGSSAILSGGYLGITSALKGPSSSGKSDRDNGLKFPNGSFAYSRELGSGLWFGVALASPFGLGLQYSPDWAGRYFVTKNEIRTYDLTPNLAYKVNDWISVAGGPDIQYARLDYEAAVNNFLNALPDGHAKLAIDDVAVGFNVGFLVTPDDATRIGITYRSRVQHDLSGSAQLTSIGPTLRFFGLSGTSADMKLTLPDSVTLSLYRQLDGANAITADIGWMHWSLLKSTNVIFSGGASLDVPRKWDDTYHFGLGFRHDFSTDLHGDVGAAFDSSPQSNTYRAPDLLIDRQIRLGAGLDYDISAGYTIGVSYEYADLGPNQFNVSSLLDGSTSGRYDEYAHSVGVSLKVRF